MTSTRQHGAEAQDTLRVVARDCPLCGRTSADVGRGPYSLGQWAVKTCPDCGFTYIDSAPEYGELFANLSWEKTFVAEQERRRDLRPISYRLSRLSRFRMKILPKRTVAAYVRARTRPGNIVDLGCGSGDVLHDLMGDYTPFGVEISTKLAGEADRRFRAHGGRCANAPSLDGLRTFPEDFFVAASLRSYLEHELHPLPVLREVHRVLAPGGVAVVKVPNYACLNRRATGRKWCGFRYPDHLNYFTPKTLTRMARACGFTVDFGITGKLPTSDNMWACLTKTGRSPGQPG